MGVSPESEVRLVPCSSGKQRGWPRRQFLCQEPVASASFRDAIHLTFQLFRNNRAFTEKTPSRIRAQKTDVNDRSLLGRLLWIFLRCDPR